MSSPADPRLDALLEALLAFARQDFSHRLEVKGDDVLDAVATGLNLLAEELDGAVASRRELEAALAERRAAEAGLVHAGRLAVVGQLAGGVAHEINNPATWVSLGLTVIGRELAHVRRAVEADEVDRARVVQSLDGAEAMLRDAVEGMQRICTVVGDLRSFARADDDIVEPVSVEDVVRASTSLAAPSFRAHAELELRFGDAPYLSANRGRIAQVVTNLVVNAAHALLEAEGRKTIRIETRPEADGALLVVEDSGPGVPEALREAIFRPFFTTKPAALGTGLGLALVRQIVERYAGDIRVRSSAELGGARFEVWFPGAHAAPPHVPARRSSRPATRARARILVVDDEPAILRSMKSLLRHAHDVDLAEGGREALARLQGDVVYDAVICDLNMPDLDGVDVWYWIRDHAPRLDGRVVLCSGAAPSPRVRDFMAKTEPLFLEKPLSAEAIDDVLDRILG